jgi:hypothetical protein
MVPGYANYQLAALAVEAHKVPAWHQVLASQHRVDKGTAASHVEVGVDIVAAGLVVLMAHNSAVAGLCRSSQRQQSCLAHGKVLKGKVRRIDEGVADCIHQDSADCMLLTGGLPASGRNIEQPWIA